MTKRRRRKSDDDTRGEGGGVGDGDDGDMSLITWSEHTVGGVSWEVQPLATYRRRYKSGSSFSS